MSSLQMVKSLARRTGATAPLKRWLTSTIINVPFHTLSPDLLVGLTRAFERQSRHEGRAYYEFGLYQGFSLWFAEQLSRGRTPKDFMHYGFDSFEGLPSTAVDDDFYQRGEFAADYDTVVANLTKFNADWSRIKLFRGFYAEAKFAELARTERFAPVSIAVIDVDIYESCVLVLDFLRPRLEVGSILIFDDYNDMDRSNEHGERKAVAEFMARTGMQMAPLFELGRECAGFEVTRAPQ